MDKMINIFLKNIEGTWISQKTIYYVNKKKFSFIKTKNQIKQVDTSNIIDNLLLPIENFDALQIINLNKGKNIGNFFILNKKDNLSNLTKVSNSLKDNGHLKIYSNNCLKIKFTRNKISYIEYLYVIKNNFKISIGLIKMNNKYIAATFTSCIKVITA